jgi:hypothetical protein
MSFQRSGTILVEDTGEHTHTWGKRFRGFALGPAAAAAAAGCTGGAGAA